MAERSVADVSARIRTVREHKGLTLAELSTKTNISISTLSRLESGKRKVTLDALLQLADGLGVTLDELVHQPSTPDPRVPYKPQKQGGMTMVPLSRGGAGDLAAYKVIIPRRKKPKELRTHDGYEWLYILSGNLRLMLGEHDLVLGPGEAAEFDTRTPHWFGSDGPGNVEAVLFSGKSGERVHLKAQTS